MHHVRRNLVIALELAERDVEAARLECVCNRSSGAAENAIVRAVRDEDAGLAVRFDVADEARGKGDDAVEEIAVDQPSESAYEAPSEKPPSEIRAGSTGIFSKTRCSARFRKSTSGPKPP